MSEYNEITAIITTEEPAVAATLDDLRFLVFEGKKGDTGDSAYEEAVKLGFEGTEAEWIASLKGEKGDPATTPAYLDEGVVRYINDYGTHVADDIYTSLLMQADINNGVLPLIEIYHETENTTEYFELDKMSASGSSLVIYFRSKEHLLAVDSTGHFTMTDRPQGGGAVESVNGMTGAVVLGASDVHALPETYVAPVQSVNGQTGAVTIPTGNPDAVLYTEQSLTPAQQAQARSNIDATKLFVVRIASESDPLTADKTFAETYAAIQNGMLVRVNLWTMDSDLWLDCLYRDETQIIFGGNVLGTQITLAFGSDESLTRTFSRMPTAVSELTNDSGYQTASDVQTAISGVRQLPAVTAADNGKSLVVDGGEWKKGDAVSTTPRVAMTASDTTPTLDPNKLYVFPEMAALTPTLATPTDNTIVNEYHFCFDSGATATVLTLPASVLQPDGFTVEANMHYEISILEGAMTAQGWAVTSA